VSFIHAGSQVRARGERGAEMVEIALKVNGVNSAELWGQSPRAESPRAERKSARPPARKKARQPAGIESRAGRKSAKMSEADAKNSRFPSERPLRSFHLLRDQR
jgi:hypothetical protein